MASPQQIAANRRNAQKSTGPRTAAGKSVSCMNALRSGIHAESLVIRGEDPGDLAQLTAEYHAEFHPVTPRERDLVDALVRNEWIARRMGIVEAELWAHHFQKADSTIPGSRFDVIQRHFSLGHAFSEISGHLERLQRRISAAERSRQRALKELAGIRAAREAEESAIEPEADPAAAPQPVETEPVSDQIGFVPSIGETTGPAALAPASLLRATSAFSAPLRLEGVASCAGGNFDTPPAVQAS